MRARKKKKILKQSRMYYAWRAVAFLILVIKLMASRLSTFESNQYSRQVDLGAAEESVKKPRGEYLKTATCASWYRTPQPPLSSASSRWRSWSRKTGQGLSEKLNLITRSFRSKVIRLRMTRPRQNGG